MTKLLLRLFVRNYTNTKDPQVRSAVGSLSGMVGIGCNVLLFIGKIIIGTLSGSVSITADAMNNLSDASSSIVTLIGFRLARMPADENHPYGHARFEYLSGLAVAAMIMVIGFELGKSSVEKILDPQPVALSLIAAAVLVGSIGVKLWLTLFNRKLGDLIDSATLLATSTDSRNDCIATLAVLAAAAVEYFFDLRIDGFVGLSVAVFILWSGWSLAKQTISPLLGEAASPELRALILDYVSAQPSVLGIHDLMVHDYGPGQRFASLHVEMDAGDSPLYCHELIDNMERECLRSHGIHLVIHYDPVITDDPELNRLKNSVEEIMREMDPRFHVHDFRMVVANGFTNLIFDVSVPPEKMQDQHSIRKQLEETLWNREQRKFYAVITFDLENFNQ